jgi:hypothetical protein
MLNFEMKKGRRFRCTSDMRDVVNPPEGVPPLTVVSQALISPTGCL